jgi:hypothetical protein
LLSFPRTPNFWVRIPLEAWICVCDLLCLCCPVYVNTLWVRSFVLLSRVSVTKDGVRISSWIYWPLTGRNYN